MKDDEEQAEAPAEAPKPKRRLPLLIALAVVVLVLAGGGFFLLKARGAHGKDGAATAPVSKLDLYLPLEPAFVVNFKDGDSLRYLQVGVTLMSHDPKAIEAAKAADPVIRDALVNLFSNQDFAVISTTKGREAMQAKALAAVRKIIQDRLGQPGIDALYFTSFVMQ